MAGKKGHGPSVKKPNVYEALRKQGYSKSKSAAISNAMVGKSKSRKKK